MKSIFPAILITGSIFLFNLSGFIEPDLNNNNINRSGKSLFLADVKIKVIYANGVIPIKKGMPDKLEINVVNNDPVLVKIRIRILDRNDNKALLSESIIPIDMLGPYNIMLYYDLPRFYQPMNNVIVVEAIPGTALDGNMAFIDTVYDSKEYCQDITFDTYNYADPCIPDSGGFGFQGRTGNFVAGFRNKDSLPVLINSVEQKFFDSIGGGNKPYNIVIYSDNGSHKPGSLIYKSPNLMTPAGTGSVIVLKPYQIDTVLTIPSGNRFFVGYRQTSTSSLKAAFQNEVPVRDSSFFFTTSDTGNVWYDFKDSSKNNRIDIAPIVSNSELKINFIMQGFYNTSTNRLNMKDTVYIYLRNSTSPFAIIDTARGKIDSVNFVRSFAMNHAGTGSYYIIAKHRNTIETWSSAPVAFTNGGKTSYNFVTAATQAYGSNMVLVNASPLRYAGYSGDIDQDGFIDLTDLTLGYNSASTFLNGYISSDLNGDNQTDLNDIITCFNNSKSFVEKITP